MIEKHIQEIEVVYGSVQKSINQTEMALSNNPDKTATNLFNDKKVFAKRCSDLIGAL